MHLCENVSECYLISNEHGDNASDVVVIFSLFPGLLHHNVTNILIRKYTDACSRSFLCIFKSADSGSLSALSARCEGQLSRVSSVITIMMRIPGDV